MKTVVEMHSAGRHVNEERLYYIYTLFTGTSKQQQNATDSIYSSIIQATAAFALLWEQTCETTAAHDKPLCH